MACLAATGCTVGPPCCPPASPALAPAYSSTSIAAPHDVNTASFVDSACWWTSFNDPTLNALIAQAVQANLDARQAYLRIVQARAQHGVVRGDWFPQLDGTGGYTYRKNSTNASQFIFNSPSASGFQVYSLGFDAAWELDLFGKIRKSIEAAAAQAFAEREAYRDILVTLQADVASQYLTLRTLQRRLTIARENLAAQSQTWEFVQRRLAAGLVGALDEAQARSNVRATEAEIPAIEEQIQVALNRLAVLLGVSPGEEMRILAGEGPIPTAIAEAATGIPADLLRRRPDVRQAQFDAIAACARVGVAEAELYPQFSLNGTISVDSRNVATMFTSDSLAFHVGPTFRWNLFAFGRVRNTIELRRAQWEESRTAYRQAVLLAVEEVENGLVGFYRELERNAALSEAAVAAREAAQLSRLEYESGLVNFQSVLDSERQRLVIERDLAQSQGAVQLNLVRIYKALGGGWQCNADAAEQFVLAEAEEPTPPAESIPAPETVPTLPPDDAIPLGNDAAPDVNPDASTSVPQGVALAQGVAPVDTSSANRQTDAEAELGPPLLPPPSAMSRASATASCSAVEEPLDGNQPSSSTAIDGN